jgi:micrococcal nuclease
MLQRLIGCFKNKNSNEIINIPTIPETHLIEEDCVGISQVQVASTKSIKLLETRSIYDSTEWLSKLDKPIDWKDTVQFVPPVETGFVIKVYDGDTITIASKLPYPESPLYRFAVRLNGIDCPEIKGKNESEKKCATIAKQEVTNLILNKIVILKNVETEKYGRILADVYIGDLHLNKYLIEKRLAVGYDGGTKISPMDWMNYYLKGEL